MTPNNDGLEMFEMLSEPERAATYLGAWLGQKGHGEFLAALKDVTSARCGVTELAARTGVRRQSLHRVLSRSGNPTLDTLQRVLGALGLQLTVVPLKPSSRAKTLGKKSSKARRGGA